MVDRIKVQEWFYASKPKLEWYYWLISPVFFVIASFFYGKASIAFIGGILKLLSYLFIVGGIISLCVVAYMYYLYRKTKMEYESRPSDQQMDEWLQEDLEAACKHSLDAIGIDESELVAEKVVITGLGGGSAAMDCGYRVGNDGIIRFTPVRITVVYFAEHQLLSYQCDIDRLTGNMLNEATNEYFYKDVVSVSTKTESRWYDIPMSDGSSKSLQTNSAQKFILVTSGGTSIEVVVDDEEYARALGGKFSQSTSIEKAIQSIRRMVRDKKSV